MDENSTATTTTTSVVEETSGNADVENNPDFALVWSFFSKFGKQLEMDGVMITDIVKWVSTISNQSSAVVAVMVKLLRKIGRRVDKQRWQKHLIKAVATQDLNLATDLQTSGFHAFSAQKKLKLLKMLCEMQFDDNLKFKAIINNEEADQQRLKPVGRDEDGLLYWHQEDEDLNIRVYIEDEDEDDDAGWKLVCKSKEDVANLIKKLTNEPTVKEKGEDSDDEGGDLVETKFQKFMKTQCTSESNDDKEEKTASFKEDVMETKDEEVFVKNDEEITEERKDLPKTEIKTEIEPEKFAEIEKIVLKTEMDECKFDVKSTACDRISKGKSFQSGTERATIGDAQAESVQDHPENGICNAMQNEVSNDEPRPEARSEKPSSDAESEKVMDGKPKVLNENNAPDSNYVKNILPADLKALPDIENSKVAEKQFLELKDDHTPAMTGADSANDAPRVSPVMEGRKIDVAFENRNHDISKTTATEISKDATLQSSSNVSDNVVKLSNEANDSCKVEVNATSVMAQSVNVITPLVLQQRTSPRQDISTNKADMCGDREESSKCDDISEANLEAKDRTGNDEVQDEKCAALKETKGNLDVEKTDGNAKTGVDGSERSSDLKTSSNLEFEKSSAATVGDNGFGENVENNLNRDSSLVVVSQISKEDSSMVNQASRAVPCCKEQTSEPHVEVEMSQAKSTDVKGANVSLGSAENSVNDDISECDAGNPTSESLHAAKQNSGVDSREVNSTASEEREINDTAEGLLAQKCERADNVTDETLPEEQKMEILEEKDETEACAVDKESRNVDSDEKAAENEKTEILQDKDKEVEKLNKPISKKKGRRRRGWHSKKKRPQTPAAKVCGDNKSRQTPSKQKKWSRLEQLKVEAESILHKGKKNSEENKDAYRTRSGRRVRNAKKEEEEVWQTFGDDVVDSNKDKDSEGDEEFRYVANKKGKPRAPTKQSPVKAPKRIVDDEPCMKCGLSSHPETILLCDDCDKGHHMACLTPPLMIIPDDDWFCPKCSKTKLIARLKGIYDELEGKMKLHQRKTRQNDYKKLLNEYTGISTSNIITSQAKSEKTKPAPKKRKKSYSTDSDDLIDDEIYSSPPSSPELKLTRRCRTKKISYDFSTFDKTILDAIGDDIDVQTDLPDEKPISGKDIRTIIAAEKGENAEELIEGKGSAGPARRKKRKLTNLNSDDDEAVESGSHYSVSSESEEEMSEEEFRLSNDTDNSEDSLTGRRRSRRNARGRRKPYVKPTKRSKRLRRKRIQEDFESSMSDASTEYEDAPKPKKKARKTKWNGYGRESSEDEYVPPLAVRDRKFINDDEDVAGEEKEKKTRRKRVMKSSSEEDGADNEQAGGRKPEQQNKDKNDGDVSSDDWSSLSSNAARSSDEESVSEEDVPKKQETAAKT